MSLQEGLGIMVIGILLIVLAATTGIIFNELSDAIAGSDDISQIAKDNAQTAADGWGSAMDWILVSVLLGMPLISMGLAYFNDIPPFFFYLSIGFALVMVIIGWALQDGLVSILNNSGIFGAYISQEMPITSYLMRNWGTYSILVLFIISIGTYIKQRGGRGYASPY